MVVDISQPESLTRIAELQMRVFSGLMPISEEYASLPILDGFNWAEQLSAIDSCQWYLVVFRSVRRADADGALLTAADDLAHDDAIHRPGFLHYFKGTPNARDECLSFCVWTDQAAARHAGRRPAHQAAMQLTAGMYETYVLERYLLRKAAGGPVTVERIEAQPAGGSTPSDTPTSAYSRAQEAEDTAASK